MAIYRTHRTVLFVDGPALKANASYLERVRRLEESLNGKCIKVDIFTVFPEAGSPSGIVSGVTTSNKSAESNYFDNARLTALGAEKGYTQTLISNPTR